MFGSSAQQQIKVGDLVIQVSDPYQPAMEVRSVSHEGRYIEAGTERDSIAGPARGFVVVPEIWQDAPPAFFSAEHARLSGAPGSREQARADDASLDAAGRRLDAAANTLFWMAEHLLQLDQHLFAQHLAAAQARYTSASREWMRALSAAALDASVSTLAAE